MSLCLREGNQFSSKRHFSISALALGTSGTLGFGGFVLARGLGKTRLPRLHNALYWPLSVPALLGPVCGLSSPGKVYRDHSLAFTKARNPSRGNQSFIWIYKARLSPTGKPSWGPLLVCRSIFLHHFPHPELRTHTKNDPSLFLSVEEAAWHELCFHTNLDWNWGPSAHNSANHFTFQSPFFSFKKWKVNIYLAELLWAWSGMVQKCLAQGWAGLVSCSHFCSGLQEELSRCKGRHCHWRWPWVAWNLTTPWSPSRLQSWI